MRAEPERQVVPLAALDVQLVGVAEGRRVAVGRAAERDDALGRPDER
jgi:hypothetical protein